MIPDRRTAVRFVDAKGKAGYAALHLGRKLYTCPVCSGRVELGAENVVLRMLDGSAKSSDHRHLHPDCADEYSTTFREIQPVPASEATEKNLNRRAARNRRRKRGKRNP